MKREILLATILCGLCASAAIRFAVMTNDTLKVSSIVPDGSDITTNQDVSRIITNTVTTTFIETIGGAIVDIDESVIEGSTNAVSGGAVHSFVTNVERSAKEYTDNAAFSAGAVTPGAVSNIVNYSGHTSSNQVAGIISNTVTKTYLESLDLDGLNGITAETATNIAESVSSSKNGHFDFVTPTFQRTDEWKYVWSNTLYENMHFTFSCSYVEDHWEVSSETHSVAIVSQPTNTSYDATKLFFSARDNTGTVRSITAIRIFDTTLKPFSNNQIDMKWKCQIGVDAGDGFVNAEYNASRGWRVKFIYGGVLEIVGANDNGEGLDAMSLTFEFLEETYTATRTPRLARIHVDNAVDANTMRDLFLVLKTDESAPDFIWDSSFNNFIGSRDMATSTFPASTNVYHIAEYVKGKLSVERISAHPKSIFDIESKDMATGIELRTKYSLTRCYWNIGGVTMSTNNVDITDIVISSVTGNVLSFGREGYDGEWTAMLFGTMESLKEFQKDASNYALPLYIMSGNRAADLIDLRRIPQAQMVEMLY